MSNPQSFKTQAQACEYLRTQGYKVADSTFGLHFRQGKIARGEEGRFSPDGLLGYAKVHLEPSVSAEDLRQSSAVVEKINADADLKTVRAKRENLRLEKELGVLMPRAEYEDEMARRALFFKSEIDGFIHRKGGELIRLVEGQESALAPLVSWWKKETADWMDAWASERDFSEDDVDDDVPAVSSSPSAGGQGGLLDE